MRSGMYKSKYVKNGELVILGYTCFSGKRIA